jgi:repressor LexA
MVDAMIGDGDIVIMHQTGDIGKGDAVAAWLKNEQEVTLKKIYFEVERVCLQPCNPFMMPFYYQADNVEVQGKVIGVIRAMGVLPAEHYFPDPSLFRTIGCHSGICRSLHT